jgi:hypothetical protein
MVDFRKRLQMTGEEQDMLYSELMGGKDEFPSDYSFAEESAPSEDQSPQEDFADRETDIAIADGLAIAEISSYPLPKYLIELEKIGTYPHCQENYRNLSPKDRLEILSLYEGGMPRSFTKYLNKVVSIIGCVIWWHPPFEAADKTGRKPGYDQIIFLTDEFDEDGLPIKIAGSSGLTNHVRGMLSGYGWFIWDEPVRFYCKREEGGPFQMINKDRVDAMRKAKEARINKKEKK